MRPAFFRAAFCAAAASAALIALGGCAVNPATGRSAFTAFMSEEDELRIGAEEHPKILREFGGVYDELPALNAWVTQMGLELAALSEKPGLPYQFTILNDEKINAFALPGGYIYITRGLLALADDASEVAGVLGHEIGHVTARHTAERYSKSVLAGVGAGVIDIIARQGGAPGAGEAVSGAASLYLQGFSREQEMESDYLGARYMARARYHPRGLTGFFRKLKGYTALHAAELGKPELADQFSVMSTHPRTADRIAQAERLERETKVRNPRYGRDALLDRIDGMIFRDHPSQGVRRGRLFQHPDLRFEFRVPPGFVMNNTPAAVTARGPEGGEMLFDAAPAASARPYTDVQEFLTREWARGVRLQGVSRITVDGMEGAAASARRGSGADARDIRLAAVRRSRDEIFRFMFVTPPARTAALEEEIRRAVYSFRSLSAEEAAAVRPMRIRTVTVKSGDTVESLAAQMPVERFKIEWFELLNAVQRGKPLVPGARVKIVTDG